MKFDIPEQPDQITPIEHSFEYYNGIIRDYTPDLCQKLIEYGRDGHGLNGFCGKYNICVDKMCEWLSSNDHAYEDLQSAFKISVSANVHCWQENLNHVVKIQDWQAVSAIKSILADILKTIPRDLTAKIYDKYIPEDEEEKRKKQKIAEQESDISLLGGTNR